ncbi:hypothetical protein HDA32_000605 [Spinactinospora alkalitolerans]|uniref:Uncharacterized protein n=1 Tax=Spinactinospora alkalitolerans TaxID=687207 RepID=A0A852TPE7_9ACTN|nr:hypothetical protein [Spinactinospora alkalitolerans]NYE45485.1 hypothetical protein [Spinactinospora alkalitolerans]
MSDSSGRGKVYPMPSSAASRSLTEKDAFTTLVDVLTTALRRQGWVTISTINDAERAQVYYAARAAEKRLQQQVTSRATKDGAVMAATGRNHCDPPGRQPGDTHSHTAIAHAFKQSG